jgi:PQQ-like domain
MGSCTWSISWGVVYKIDVRSGTVGTIIWKMDPEVANQDRNRGAALWGNLVISVTGYAGRVIATDKETGKIVWDKNLLDQTDLELTAAPLALKDLTVIGGSGGDRGLRNWVAALDPKTGETKWKTYSIPAPGEPGRHCWKRSDFRQCEYLALANNASASNGTSSGQYRAGLGWRAPVSERGRQASTAMLQRTGMAARP